MEISPAHSQFLTKRCGVKTVTHNHFQICVDESSLFGGVNGQGSTVSSLTHRHYFNTSALEQIPFCEKCHPFDKDEKQLQLSIGQDSPYRICCHQHL